MTTMNGVRTTIATVSSGVTTDHRPRATGSPRRCPPGRHRRARAAARSGPPACGWGSRRSPPVTSETLGIPAELSVTRDRRQRDLAIRSVVVRRCLGTGWLRILTVGIWPMDGAGPTGPILDDDLELDGLGVGGPAHADAPPLLLPDRFGPLRHRRAVPQIPPTPLRTYTTFSNERSVVCGFF